MVDILCKAALSPPTLRGKVEPWIFWSTVNQISIFWIVGNLLTLLFALGSAELSY